MSQCPMPVFSRVGKDIKGLNDEEQLVWSRDQFLRWLKVHIAYELRIALEIGLRHFESTKAHT